MEQSKIIDTLEAYQRAGERISMPELSPDTSRERGRRKSQGRRSQGLPPSLVVGVVYIECTTPSPLMLQGGALMP